MQLHRTTNMEWMRVPIGSNKFVEDQLKGKLCELQEIVDRIAGMPYKHEAFTLLRWCGAQCRVTHLCRTIPPVQLRAFLVEFDAIVRKGFEKLIGTTLEDRWWNLSKLPSKFGGMGLRTGLDTHGA